MFFTPFTVSLPRSLPSVPRRWMSGVPPLSLMTHMKSGFVGEIASPLASVMLGD